MSKPVLIQLQHRKALVPWSTESCTNVSCNGVQTCEDEVSNIVYALSDSIGNYNHCGLYLLQPVPLHDFGWKFMVWSTVTVDNNIVAVAAICWEYLPVLKSSAALPHYEGILICWPVHNWSWESKSSNNWLAEEQRSRILRNWTMAMSAGNRQGNYLNSILSCNVWHSSQLREFHCQHDVKVYVSLLHFCLTVPFVLSVLIQLANAQIWIFANLTHTSEYFTIASFRSTRVLLCLRQKALKFNAPNPGCLSPCVQYLTFSFVHVLHLQT